MKKDVADNAAETVAPKKSEFSLIDENLLNHPWSKGHARCRFGGNLRV